MKPSLIVFLLLLCFSLARAESNPMVGSWVPTLETKGLTRLSITWENGGTLIQAWGNLQAPDQDWGLTTLTCYSSQPDHQVQDRALATWDNGAVRTLVVLKLSPEGDHLTVETFTNIKDNSGRINCASELEFVRQKN